MSDFDETARKADEVIADLFAKPMREVTAARAKYGPLVRQLSDHDFIGLVLEIEAERPRRLAKASAMLRGLPFYAPENER